MSPSRARRLRPLPEPSVRAEAASEPVEPLLGGVELLSDGVRAAVVDGAGGVVRSVRARFDAPRTATVEELSAVLTDTVRRGLSGLRVRGVGIASAGLVDDGSGVIRDIHDLPALRGFPVAAVVADAVRVPAFADHHARMQVLGDRWFGLGAGRSAFASVSTGSTLGVGLLHEGHVIAPQGGRSGAHITVDARGRRCPCGARGCWRTIATTSWLRERAAALRLGDVDGVGDVVALARDDPRADGLAAAYASNIALGLATIQHLVAPGLYILHGDAAGGGSAFLGRIEAALRSVSSWAEAAEQPRVVVAETDPDDVALLGGAGLVLSRTGS